MKEVKIEVPEGYEIDKENSTFECIKFKPKGTTYDDILNKICYKDRDTIGWPEDEEDKRTIGLVIRPSTCPSLKQMQRLTAINQLMNVAYYFNEIVDKDKPRYPIFIPRAINDKVVIEVFLGIRDTTAIVGFRSEESANKAIEILGTETVKLAISL